MSDGNEEFYNKQFSQLAFNKLYKICYKNVTAQRAKGQFLQQDEVNVVKCHQKLIEAFQIILPSVMPAGEEAE